MTSGYPIEQYRLDHFITAGSSTVYSADCVWVGIKGSNKKGNCISALYSDRVT